MIYLPHKKSDKYRKTVKSAVTRRRAVTKNPSVHYCTKILRLQYNKGKVCPFLEKYQIPQGKK